MWVFVKKNPVNESVQKILQNEINHPASYIWTKEDVGRQPAQEKLQVVLGIFEEPQAANEAEHKGHDDGWLLF